MLRPFLRWGLGVGALSPGATTPRSLDPEASRGSRDSCLGSDSSYQPDYVRSQGVEGEGAGVLDRVLKYAWRRAKEELTKAEPLSAVRVLLPLPQFIHHLSMVNLGYRSEPTVACLYYSYLILHGKHYKTPHGWFHGYRLTMVQW